MMSENQGLVSALSADRPVNEVYDLRQVGINRSSHDKHNHKRNLADNMERSLASESLLVYLNDGQATPMYGNTETVREID
jgi:hypothetical protein